SLLIHASRCGLNAGRRAQLERAKDRVHGVAADVAERTGAEIPPAAPYKRQINRVKGTHRGRADPQIPIERRGYRRRILWPGDTLRPVLIEESPRGPVRPNVRLPDRPNGAAPHRLAEMASLRGSLALVTHLSRDLRLARVCRHLARLPHRVRQWFLAINMLSAFQRLHRGEGVMMIRRCNHDRVDFLHLIEHLPVISKLLRLRIFPKDVPRMVLVHVAQRDDVFTLHGREVRTALPADTNACQI